MPLKPFKETNKFSRKKLHIHSLEHNLHFTTLLTFDGKVVGRLQHYYKMREKVTVSPLRRITSDCLLDW